MDETTTTPEVKEKPVTKKDLEDRLTRLEKFASSQVAAIAANFTELEHRTKALEEKLKEKDLSLLPQEAPKEKQRQGAQEIPMPTDWQTVVSELLDSRFDVKIWTLEDKPGFQLIIKVPPELSSKQAKMEGVGDVRSKVLKPNDGVNGLKDYITMVRDNIRKEHPSKL